MNFVSSFALITTMTAANIAGFAIIGAVQKNLSAADLNRCVATHAAAGEADPVATCTPQTLRMRR